MGDQTPLLQDADTVEVELDLTCRAERQIASMSASLQQHAHSALTALAARLGDYFARAVENISYIGRTREGVFTITFEVFGPVSATVHDITLDRAPIDETAGYFRIKRDGKTLLIASPPGGPDQPTMADVTGHGTLTVARTPSLNGKAAERAQRYALFGSRPNSNVHGRHLQKPSNGIFVSFSVCDLLSHLAATCKMSADVDTSEKVDLSCSPLLGARPHIIARGHVDAVMLEVTKSRDSFGATRRSDGWCA